MHQRIGKRHSEAPRLYLLLFLAFGASVQADVIRLKPDRLVTGKILTETEQSLTIETPDGKFTFPKTRVTNISRESPAENYLREVGGYFASGRLDSGLALFHEKALQQAFAPGTLENLLLENCRDNAGAVTATSASAEQLSRHLAGSLDPAPELLIFSAMLSVESDAADQARQALLRINIPLTRSPVWPEKTLQSIFSRIGNTALTKNRGDIIATSVQLTQAFIPGYNAGAHEMLAVFAQIDKLRQDGDYLGAVAAFRPELFLRRADIFTPLAERVTKGLLASQATPQKLAALESARVTVLPFLDQQLRLLFVRRLINDLLAAHRFDSAQAIADQLSERDPDLGAFAIHLMEFRRRQSEILENNPLEKYKLAAWARSMGLLEESRDLFRSLQDDPRFAPNVKLQLNLIEKARCTDEIARMRQMFDANDFTGLQMAVTEFERSHPPEEFVSKARDLVQLAKFQQWSQRKGLSSKAEAEFQQAERLANRRQFDEALIYLNKLQLDAGDTKAAAKATALRNKILRAQALDRSKAK